MLQKRSVFLVAIGAALVSLAPAVAAETVRCVPNTSVDPSCQTAYATIQLAVNAAVPGDIILVGPGKYTAPAPGPVVMIPSTKHDIFILGAQAGVDARKRGGFGEDDGSKQESVVDATGTTGSTNAGFIVQAANVTIDGFTIQNANSTANANDSGIDLKGNGNGLTPANGAKILNNILQNNGQALSLNFEGFGPVTNVLVEHNFFRDNNVVSGDGIFTSGCANVTITENSFTGDPTAAIGINNSSNVSITENESANDGTFVIFTNTTNSQFSHNTGSHFVAPGSAFAGTGGAAVSVGPSNNFLDISSNTLFGGTGAIKGIRFWLFGASPGTGIGPSQNVQVRYNSVQSMPLGGIVAEHVPGGALANSLLIGNRSQANGQDGIFLDANNSGNTLTENSAAGNKALDCHDASTGSGTLGTGNLWFRNTGNTSAPVGLCKQGNTENGDDGNGQGEDGNSQGRGKGHR